MAVEEDDGRGGKRRTTEAKDTARGTPQGAPITPLLANLYMRRFILAWKKLGLERELKAYIGTQPSRKRVQRICDEISAMTQRETAWKEAEEVVAAINAKTRGWAKFFRPRSQLQFGNEVKERGSRTKNKPGQMIKIIQR